MFSLEEVRERTSWTTRKIMYRVGVGKFPAPIIHEGRSIFWSEEEIEKFLRNRRRRERFDDDAPRPKRKRRSTRKRVGAHGRDAQKDAARRRSD